MGQVLTNVELMGVREGKSGQGQYGEWTMYTFTVRIAGWEQEKITYFKSGNKPAPTDGMMVASLEVEEDYYQGNFSGYKAKSMQINQGTPSNQPPRTVPPSVNPQGNVTTMGVAGTGNPPPPKETPKLRDDSITMWTSYAKDIMVALINKDMLDDNIQANVKRLMGIATSCGASALRDATALLSGEPMNGFEKDVRKAAGEEAPKEPARDLSEPLFDEHGQPIPF